jgi:adsorption protein B
MTFATALTHVAAELALFSAVGFFLFALNDLAVDGIYFIRRFWRSATVYRRYPKAFGQTLSDRGDDERFIAIFVPAWDESAVIAAMLKATTRRLEYDNYRIFVGHYRNDPATAAAIASVDDPHVEPVLVPADGPTTKADCLNHLYDALIAFELRRDKPAAAVVLHDSEDVVHPLELIVFNSLIDRAGIIQLPVEPLPDPKSRWIAGHYCDEFAEAHTKELVVREAIGASVPLAGVGCAIARAPIARLAAIHEGYPFSGTSLTEDYEMGLRIGELGLKTMFVRMPAVPGSRGLVASRGHFPSTFGEAVRQKARWLGGIGLSGWDRLGWRGGLGERWMRMRDRRGPIAALLLLSGYVAALIWSQMWLAQALGAPVQVGIDPALSILLWINLWLLAWRIAMRALFTGSSYGWGEGLRSIPRLVVGNFIAIAAAARAVSLYIGRQPQTWDKTRHIFPKDLPGEVSA